jgi:class 3 adenylate cyclase
MIDPPTGPDADPSAGERYLLLADITGYTGFMAGVEIEHGADFSRGIPAAYGILGGLLDSVVMGVAPAFDLVKLEGDAVFAVAPTARLDGDGDQVLERLGTMYQAFIDSRTRAIPSNDHVCIACPNVARLDLKVILHRGHTVRQTVGASSDLLGPAVNLAHRLLKNTVRDRIGSHPYLFLTDEAATALGLAGIGLGHHEDYPDAGPVDGRVVGLGESLPSTPST